MGDASKVEDLQPGEIDYRAVAPHTRALTEALALDDHIERLRMGAVGDGS